MDEVEGTYKIHDFNESDLDFEVISLFLSIQHYFSSIDKRDHLQRRQRNRKQGKKTY